MNERDWRGYLLFLAIFIFGWLIGGAVNQIFGFTNIQDSLLASLVTLVIPATIIFWLWRRFGRTA